MAATSGGSTHWVILWSAIRREFLHQRVTASSKPKRSIDEEDAGHRQDQTGTGSRSIKVLIGTVESRDDYFGIQLVVSREEMSQLLVSLTPRLPHLVERQNTNPR